MVAITVESDLIGSHKLVALARILGVSQNEALGILVRLWLWAMASSPTGKIKRFHSQILDFGAGDPEKLFARLEEVGWLDATEDGWKIHDWRKHSGKRIAKQRAKTEYMKIYRARLKGEPLPEPPVEKAPAPEPKPRKESTKAAMTPEADRAFEIFWNAYPRKQEKGKAREAWARIFRKAKTPEKVEAALESIQSSLEGLLEEFDSRTERSGRDEALRFTKLPTTFLNSIRSDVDAGYVGSDED